MKWILLILVLGVGYAIYTGNMGGARDAAGNYNKILTTKPTSATKN